MQGGFVQRTVSFKERGQNLKKLKKVIKQALLKLVSQEKIQVAGQLEGHGNYLYKKVDTA